MDMGAVFCTNTNRQADGFITYQYDELAAMSGVLWENTLTYSPDDMDFGLQASVGFPFQVSGERDMGQAFTDSWQVGTRLNISLVATWIYTHRVSTFYSTNSDWLRNFVLKSPKDKLAFVISNRLSRMYDYCHY